MTPAGGPSAFRFWRRRPLPPALRSAIGPDERISVTAPCVDGRTLAVSRLGLWVVDEPTGGAGPDIRDPGVTDLGVPGPAGDPGPSDVGSPAADSGPAVVGGGVGAHRIGWELVARARLTARVLSVIPTRVVGRLPDEIDVLVDEPELVFGLATRSGLTDVVHQRVRRSVAASRHLPYPGAGGWVVLRRVPGRDGLTRQVRLDPGADVAVPGFGDAVLAVADELAESMPAG